jgi:hypothetical protein
LLLLSWLHLLLWFRLGPRFGFLFLLLPFLFSHLSFVFLLPAPVRYPLLYLTFLTFFLFSFLAAMILDTASLAVELLGICPLVISVIWII